MKLISWNVNGIRAAIKKGFADFVSTENPDILCLQETKARPEQVELPLELGGYQNYWSSAEKAGYSGVAVFTREKPLNVKEGLGIEEHDNEGRVLTLEYPDFTLVNVYTPNAQDGLRRLPYPSSSAAISTSPTRKSTSRGPRKTARTPASPMPSAEVSINC